MLELPLTKPCCFLSYPKAQRMEKWHPWLTFDKVEHIIAFLIINILIVALTNHGHYPFFCLRSIALSSITALTADTTKEFSDEIILQKSISISICNVTTEYRCPWSFPLLLLSSSLPRASNLLTDADAIQIEIWKSFLRFKFAVNDRFSIQFSLF